MSLLHGARRTLVSFAALLAVCAPTSRADDPPPPPPPWSGEAAGSWVQTTGNSSSQSIGAGVALVYDVSPWKVTFKSAYVRTEAEEVKQAEKFVGLLRGERSLSEHVSLYSQASALRDTFAGFDGLETFEAGGLYRPANGPKHTLAFAAGLGVTAEQRVFPGEDSTYASGRLAGAYKYAFSTRADFTEEVSTLWDLGDLDNMRLTAATSLTAALARVFSVRLTHQLSYVNQPVPGKKSTDTTFLASIVAKWPAPATP